MFYKFVVFFALLTVVSADYLAAPAYSRASYSYGAAQAITTPAVVSQHFNSLRSDGQVSTYGKSINSPHSSAYKSDIRVSHDSLAYPYASGYATVPANTHSYIAPAYSHSYATPSYVTPSYSHEYAAPVHAHGYVAYAPTGLFGVSYYPATSTAHFSYSNRYGLHYSY